MDRGRKPKNESRSRERSRSRDKRRDGSEDGGRDRSRDRPSGARLADKRVYISNIPYDSRWQDIKDLFRQEVGEVAFVELFHDDNEKPRGCGIIEFVNESSAKKAIEKMHRHELGGRKIVVKEDYDVERDKSGRIVTKSAGGGGGGGGSGGGGGRDRDRGDSDFQSRDRGDRDRDRWDNRRNDNDLSPSSNSLGRFGNTYGLSQQFLESLGIDGALISKVFVSNLDFRVDEKKLKEVFRLAGRVLFVDINKDKDGKSRGHGIVEFEHPVEAVQAISMFNDQQLYERRMHVKMDRLSDPIADLAKNRLPDGLKSIGMGLGQNGNPLVDVARNLPSTNTGTTSNTPSLGTISTQGNQVSLNAMNIPNLGMNQLATLVNPSSFTSDAAIAAASNVFNLAAAGMGQNQFGSAGLTGLQGISMNALGVGGGGIPNALTGGGGSQQNLGNLGGNILPSGNAQQSSFQNQTGGNQGPANPNFQGNLDYGYSTNTGYSSNVNNAFQNPNPGQNMNQNQGPPRGGGGGQQPFNGVGSGGSSSAPTNTVIISNLPPSCTWQALKSKFREYGEIVFAEKRDNNTGIVRFASERDAERAVKVFHNSRVDGRLVDVRYL